MPTFASLDIRNFKYLFLNYLRGELTIAFKCQRGLMLILDRTRLVLVLAQPKCQFTMQNILSYHRTDNSLYLQQSTKQSSSRCARPRNGDRPPIFHFTPAQPPTRTRGNSTLQSTRLRTGYSRNSPPPHPAIDVLLVCCAHANRPHGGRSRKKYLACSKNGRNIGQPQMERRSYYPNDH